MSAVRADTITPLIFGAVVGHVVLNTHFVREEHTPVMGKK